MAERWHRDRWLDAIWNDETLKPNPRAVAYAYARFAADKTTAWATYPELRRRTGISSRNAISAALRTLETAGYLVLIKKSAHHKSGTYGLAIPHRSSTDSVPLSGTESVPLTDPTGLSSTESVPLSSIDFDAQQYRFEPSAVSNPYSTQEKTQEKTREKGTPPPSAPLKGGTAALPRAAADATLDGDPLVALFARALGREPTTDERTEYASRLTAGRHPLDAAADVYSASKINYAGKRRA